MKASPTARRQYGSLYSILDGPGDQLRLFEILPANRAENLLQCRLHVCGITDHIGAYEALSYTWSLQNEYQSKFGSTHDERVIECDGVHIIIDKNLYLALRRLRRRDRSRTIWADAVCIN